MAIKKKYQPAPKERKFAFIGLPFVFIAVLCMIPIMIGVGIIPCLIIVLLCFTIFIILFVMSKKEHKIWVEEGHKEYRYFDTETGQEVDENGNPLSEEPAPVQEPKQEEPNLPEPDENGDIEEPAPVLENKPQPQAAQKPQQKPKYESPVIDMMQTVLPPVGFGLLCLVFLLRTIISIRELVHYGQSGGIQYFHLPTIVRLFGTLVLLIITVVSLINRYTKKQTANQYFSSFLKIAIWFAIIGFYGFAYHATHITTSTITCIKYGFDFFDSMLDIIIEAFIFVAFGIAIIVFAKMALANKIDCKTRKIFAAVPFGIMIIYSILFMIFTGISFAPGYAVGYYVTASIMIVACGAIGCIPFFAKFEDKPLDEAAASKAAAAAVAPVAAAPAYQEPKYEEPKSESQQQAQPQKRNNDGGDPEVKSNKKGLIIILIVVAALVLCGGGGVGVYFLIKNANNQNREDGPSDDDTSYYSSSSSKSSSKSSSSSSRSSSKSSSSSAAVSKTPKEVMADICKNIYGSAKYYDDNNSDYNYWYSDSGFVTIVSWTELDESYLQDAAEFVVGKLPSYLVNIDQLHSGTWSDGLSGYFQNFTTQDEQVKVEIGSYYDDTGLNCQVLSHFNY